MSLKLYSNRLEVTIAEPGIAPNTTCRFDRAGFITQVCLDNTHTFCGEEPHNLLHPSSGGVGLCNEFRFMAPFEEAAIGDFFMKPGIGLLRKCEAHWFFYLSYEQRPFAIDISKTPNGFCFETHPIPCAGYSMREIKTVEVIDNRIEMHVEIENAGEKNLSFTEYCHNFLSIDGLPTGAEYIISMPVTDQSGKLLKSGEALLGTPYGFTFSKCSETASLADISKEEIISVQKPFYWELRHKSSGLSVTETVDFSPAKLTVWACTEVVSPEVQYAADLKPGERARWTRTWIFRDDTRDFTS